MANYIIAGILLILVIAGLRTSIKHFRGEGGCCGGGSYKPKKKKLRGKVIGKYVLQINGMHCQNCANAVTEIINDTDGAAARVNLKRKQATILYDRDVDLDLIREKIRKRGYEVM